MPFSPVTLVGSAIGTTTVRAPTKANPGLILYQLVYETLLRRHAHTMAVPEALGAFTSAR